MPFYAQQIKDARSHLQSSDRIMKSIIHQVGSFTARTRRDRFLTLVRSIVSQQISGAAANTILARLVELVSPDTIEPTSLMRYSVDELRWAGLSKQKASYILDLAHKVNSGVVDLVTVSRADDATVIAQLTQVRGIGVWTAQMFLMFSLGRLNVLPVDDLGIQNAIRKHYQPRGTLTKDKIRRIAAPWQPYSTIACWYLWRSLDVKS